MIDKTKKYQTPKGEIVTGAELVEVPTTEDVVRERISATLVRNGHSSKMASILAGAAVHALREADMRKEPDSTMSELARLGQEMQPEMYEVDPEGWIEHDGGPCPVDGDTRVQVRFDTGTGPCEAKAHAWHWNCVTHYRVVGS